MMMSLFSVFDPSSYFLVQLNWLILIIVILYIPVKFYMMESGLISVFKLLFVSVGEIFKDVSVPNHLALNFLSMMTLVYLVFSNLLGLFPFIYTGTAHPLITLGLGVVLWLSFFLMGYSFNFKLSCAHLVPEGSPLFLSPLMVLIESISCLIRPFTLSIRLAANMMAGHLIMGLLSSLSMISLFGVLGSIILQNILMILEFGVSIIQGFVFSILLLLYALEYN